MEEYPKEVNVQQILKKYEILSAVFSCSRYWHNIYMYPDI